MPGFKPARALDEGKGPQILLAFDQHVVEADMSREGFQHRRGDGLAVQALLQIVERGHVAVPITSNSPSTTTPGGSASTISGKLCEMSSPVLE